MNSSDSHWSGSRPLSNAARTVLLVLASVAIVGCEGFLQADLSDSQDKLVTRTYHMTGCQETFGTSDFHPVPCVSHVGGTTMTVADSARLELRPDGTTVWMIAQHTCPAAVQICTTTSPGVQTLTGTYHFGDNAVLAHLAQAGSSGSTDVSFAGPVPDRVTSRWAGPDSLSFDLSNGAYLAVLKP
jgi:hypothetical protein